MLHEVHVLSRFSHVQLCATLDCQAQTLNCNSQLILNKAIFAGRISGSLFILGQQLLPQIQ